MKKKKDPPAGQWIDKDRGGRDPDDPKGDWFRPQWGRGAVVGIERPWAVDFALDGAWLPVAGYGGWEMTARPDRQAFVDWEGREPLAISGAFIFRAEDIGTGKRVEEFIRELEKLAAGQGDIPPPRVLFDAGGLVPHDYTRAPANRFVIEDLTWLQGPEDVLVNPQGRRTFQRGTLVLRKHVAEERAERKPNDRRKGGGGGGKVTAREGDTLRKIAARRDIPRRLWPKLKSLNGIRDMDKKLKKGRTVKLPPVKHKAGEFG